MAIIKSQKALKFLSATLISLLLVSAFVVGSIVSVKAPVTEPIIMWAVINTDPYPGYYGGYHDMMYAIKDALREIGIDLRFQMYDAFTWWDLIWETKWNVPGDADGVPTKYTYGVDGWDISISGWWLNPTSYVWLDEVVYSWNNPPEGYNIMSWTNTKADYFYRQAQTAPDSTTHKNYLGLWQEEVMHNPPAILLYYYDTMTATASYLKGVDDAFPWLYELSQVDIDEAKFEEVAPAARKAAGSDTFIWAADHPIWNFIPMFVLSYTEEAVHDVSKGLLYRSSQEDYTTMPPTGDFIVKPTVANGFPTWRQEGDIWVATINIKPGLTWTSGAPFNATDVAFSMNALLDPTWKAYAYKTFSLLWDHIEVAGEYAVDIYYKPGMGPDYDLAGYIAQYWAWGMYSWQQLKDEKLPLGRWSQFALDPIPESQGGKGLECLGPYVPVEWVKDVYLKFERREEWVDKLGYSSTLPKYFIIKIMPSKEARLLALQKLEADFIEYPTAPLEVWQTMSTWPTHKVYTRFYPEGATLWLNHRNPILSNRYVRLAIAHAIPYKKIFDEILPGYGVANAYPGKTWIFPHHEGFNWELPPYEESIEKAKMYMDMWRYSQVGKLPYTLGPVGDADFSGLVEIADFPIWAENIGTTSTKDALYPYPDKWPALPGNDIDPDHDNNNFVEMSDFYRWRESIGKEYPFSGAR